jgi:4-amino-4-deoxy-L-arabinose transferase-like glycosyltransferase
MSVVFDGFVRRRLPFSRMRKDNASVASPRNRICFSPPMASRASSPHTVVAPPWFVLLLLAAGLFLRLRLAWLTFLNPDEALHFFLAYQPSLTLAYRASLTTAHPPLMVLLLHYWSWLGDSAFLLRLPFAIAGTLFCWTMFRWVERIAGGNAGFIALALLLFSPPLISLSAEVRQYSLLLLFCAGCLYFLELAFEEPSAQWMALSMAALYLAILTHYSALIFAAAAGLYSLQRLLRSRLPAPVTALWVAGQAGALAICVFLYFTQISNLRASGVTSEIAATWLRSSIYHPGEDHFDTFAVGKTVRLFRYLFSHGTIGVLGLCLFLVAIILLLWQRDAGDQSKPTPRELAGLFLSPFVVALAAGVAGLYPYGGTRHDVVLAVFAMPAIAIGLDRLKPKLMTGWKWGSLLALSLALFICNLFPSPSGPYIAPKNQNKTLMTQATDSLKSAPVGSVIFTDFQGRLVLNYYLCRKDNAVPFEATPVLLRSRCGNYDLITSAATQQGFDRNAFPETLARAWQLASPEKLWLFQAGWIDDKQPEWIAELRSLGCEAPRHFGRNILICPLSRSNR